MQTLGAYVGTRDNNFNLTRFVAAFLVLVSHAFALSTGDPGTEPLRQLLGITPGSVAVDIFFVTSGFLVTASILSRADIATFVIARALRIYPGLIVAVSLTVLLAGLFFSTLPFADFATARATWSHLLHNVTLVFGISYQLPGVFETVPYARAVNGSLWTLPFEVRMYAGLAALWWVTWRLCRSSEHAFAIAATVVALVALGAHFAWQGPRYADHGAMLAAAFFTGAAMYAWRRHIPMSWGLFGLCTAVTLASALHRDAFFVAYTLLLPYMVLFLAHVPAGGIRRFNRLGDYSYGLYIYGFPVQQATVALLPGLGPAGLLAVSAPATLLCAVASWYLVEKRALAWKGRPWRTKRASYPAS